ncbi:elongation factor 1-beta [Methanolobus halotolerans]|uniref:Elongation factor 1-beta n=1 Tax=Methanolobus halotolerans TaxID=2052935 RepID=A0A4E0PUN6_9EURY|nr:elongation factor 1-beta [Methanolobus halotolerans]TGC07038.1 elongation factor 1-beta [Methanolobus halotolerans]
MGDVAATIKIMPVDVDTDLTALKERLIAALPEGATFGTSKEEPIAFGLNALMMVVMVGDLEGGTEQVEEAFAKVEGVESVMVTEVGRPL